MIFRRILFALIVCSMSAVPLAAREAQAAQYKSSWFYLGGNYGYYKARGGDFDDEADLIEGLVGFQFSPNIGIEASVIDFGRFGDRLSDAEVDGWTVGAVLRLPLTETTAIYAKGGMLFWDAAVRDADDVEEAVDDSDVFYGVGVDFRVSQLIGVNVEYVRYELDIDGSGFATPIRANTDIDAAKIGVRLNF